MDICRNISVSGGLQYQQQLPESQLGSLDDLFSGHPLEGERDVNMEWLSTFMEECLSSTGNSLLPPTPTPTPTPAPAPTQPFHTPTPTPKPTQSPAAIDKLVIPVKGTRSKRKRCSQSHAIRKTKAGWWSPQPHNPLHTSSDPPLLQQAYWLADSELIFPPKQHQNGQVQEQEQEQEAAVIRQGRRKKKKKNLDDNGGILMMEKEEEEGNSSSSNGGMRKCSHCLSQRTPQWRAGPLGPKTLCNACGVRYKSGRLLPEYRPAKSPTFVSFMHSNSHKKVLEMRTLSLLTSDSSSSSPS